MVVCIVICKIHSDADMLLSDSSASLSHHSLWLRYSSVFHQVCDLLLSLHTISRQSVASIQRNEVLLLVAATLVAASTQTHLDRSVIGQNHVESIELLKNILCFGSK